MQDIIETHLNKFGYVLIPKITKQNFYPHLTYTESYSEEMFSWLHRWGHYTWGCQISLWCKDCLRLHWFNGMPVSDIIQIGEVANSNMPGVRITMACFREPISRGSGRL